jgi:signal transduction histidine kinase
MGDRDRLGQVVTNLLTNAMKYSPQADKVEIGLASSNDRVVIQVRDYGVGIAKVHQNKIFERFYRVNDSHENTFPGLGMGLYIACAIVKHYAGTITVESEEGKGSTFSVSLPVHKAQGK